MNSEELHALRIKVFGAAATHYCAEASRTTKRAPNEPTNELRIESTLRGLLRKEGYARPNSFRKNESLSQRYCELSGYFGPSGLH